MKTITQYSNCFGLVLALCVIIISGCSCSAPKPTTNPLAGWTFRTFDDFLPLPDRRHYQLDKVVTDDYRNFIVTNGLNAETVTGFYEDETGQRAVEFEAFWFGKEPNTSWRYVLIYNKENVRIKVIKYGRIHYQS